MPGLAKKFKGKLEIEYRDIDNIENYKLLLGLQEKYGAKLKNILPVFFLNGYFLENVEKDGRKNLETFVVASLNRQAVSVKDLPTIDLIAHFKTFGPLVVINAGLIDGINPCAFTVIVFFISFLALQGYRKRELIVIGLSFIISVFLTYLLIGIGLFGFLYRLKSFWLFTKIFNFSIGLLSVILGFLALYDLFKFKKTGETEGLVLQLPKTIKNYIHYVVGLHYRKSQEDRSQGVSARHIFRLVLSAIITGFLVSILEAVCTGQVYLPAITFVLKMTRLKLQALVYLLLYNFMFIIPLLIIFLFALLGVTSEQFSKVLRKHLSAIKLFMAILFFTLGFFLIFKK